MMWVEETVIYLFVCFSPRECTPMGSPIPNSPENEQTGSIM